MSEIGQIGCETTATYWPLQREQYGQSIRAHIGGTTQGATSGHTAKGGTAAHRIVPTASHSTVYATTGPVCHRGDREHRHMPLHHNPRRARCVSNSYKIRHL
eukprot:7353303-Prymnesium_polylepis.1